MPKIIKTKKLTKKSYNTPTLYAIAVVKGLVVFFMGLLLCSFLVLRSQQSNFFFYLTYVFISLGAFICGYVASKKINGRGFIKGLISSGIYLALIIVLSLALMRLHISFNILLLAPLCLLSGFTGGVLAVK